MWTRTECIASRRVIAFDGERPCGSRDAPGSAIHLLSGLCQTTGVVLAANTASSRWRTPRRWRGSAIWSNTAISGAGRSLFIT